MCFKMMTNLLSATRRHEGVGVLGPFPQQQLEEAVHELHTHSTYVISIIIYRYHIILDLIFLYIIINSNI